MCAAGIGGVELQILYPVEADDPARGIHNRAYLSPEFFDCVRFAAEAAKARGMAFDLTLGSSWSYGWPFVPMELSAPNVIPYTIDIQGPCKFRCDFTTRLYGACVACVLGRMENGEMLPETIVDVTGQVADTYLFNWEWGKELREIDVPAGLHLPDSGARDVGRHPACLRRGGRPRGRDLLRVRPLRGQHDPPPPCRVRRTSVP